MREIVLLSKFSCMIMLLFYENLYVVTPLSYHRKYFIKFQLSLFFLFNHKRKLSFFYVICFAFGRYNTIYIYLWTIRFFFLRVILKINLWKNSFNIFFIYIWCNLCKFIFEKSEVNISNFATAFNDKKKSKTLK